LAIVVQGETEGADGVHDGGVVDDSIGNGEGVGAEEEVGVGGRAVLRSAGISSSPSSRRFKG
jgi:hypothetical protein